MGTASLLGLPRTSSSLAIPDQVTPAASQEGLQYPAQKRGWAEGQRGPPRNTSMPFPALSTWPWDVDRLPGPKGHPRHLSHSKGKSHTWDLLPVPPKPCQLLGGPSGLSWAWGLPLSPKQVYLILQHPATSKCSPLKKLKDSQKNNIG